MKSKPCVSCRKASVTGDYPPQRTGVRVWNFAHCLQVARDGCLQDCRSEIRPARSRALTTLMSFMPRSSRRDPGRWRGAARGRGDLGHGHGYGLNGEDALEFRHRHEAFAPASGKIFGNAQVHKAAPFTKTIRSSRTTRTGAIACSFTNTSRATPGAVSAHRTRQDGRRSSRAA